MRDVWWDKTVAHNLLGSSTSTTSADWLKCSIDIIYVNQLLIHLKRFQHFYAFMY